MKQMEYDGSGVTRVLHVENCNGEQIVVLNVRGSHPCAYVSVSLTDELADKILTLALPYDYFESGKRVPKRLATLVRLAQVYNVDWEELLKDPKERFM